MEPSELIIAYSALAVFLFLVVVIAKGLAAESFEAQTAREGRERFKRIRGRTSEVLRLGRELMFDIRTRDRLIKVYNDFDGPVAEVLHGVFIKILGDEYLLNTSHGQKCTRVLSLLRLIEAAWERHEHAFNKNLATEVTKDIQNFMEAILVREKILELPAH